MDEATKNRLRLLLKSERAMGLGWSPADWTQLHFIPQAPPMCIRPRDQRRPCDPLFRPFRAPAAGCGSTSAPAIATPPPPPTSEPFASPILSIEERHVRLVAMDETEVRGCTKCGLCESRKNTVFGEGAPDCAIDVHRRRAGIHGRSNRPPVRRTRRTIARQNDRRHEPAARAGFYCQRREVSRVSPRSAGERPCARPRKKSQHAHLIWSDRSKSFGRTRSFARRSRVAIRPFDAPLHEPTARQLAYLAWYCGHADVASVVSPALRKGRQRRTQTPGLE